MCVLARVSVLLAGVGLCSVDSLCAQDGFRTKFTAAEAIPVVALDERVIGTGKHGPITKELIDAFRARTKTDGHQVYG